MIFNYFLISLILLQLYRYYQIISSGKKQLEATIILSLTLVVISIYRRVLINSNNRNNINDINSFLINLHGCNISNINGCA